MLSSSRDLIPQNTHRLEIKLQENKFFSRLLSKETSKLHQGSFRLLYYGGGSVAAIPFTWESQPGTPKHRMFSHTSVSHHHPLTPPPSHSCSKKPTLKNSRSCNLGKKSFMRKISFLKSPSLLSSSLSSPSRSRSMSFDGGIDYKEMSLNRSSTASNMCFKIGSAYSTVTFKKALLAMFGRGSA